MKKFLYTENKNSADKLLAKGYPLFQHRDCGIWIFVNIQKELLEFDKSDEIIELNQITF
ncbi:hypothetical protein AALA22_08900 [Anaerovoracaceae bacterium 41-7]